MMKFLKYSAFGIMMFSACNSGSDIDKPDTDVPLIVLEGEDPRFSTDDICGVPETHVLPLLSAQTLQLDLHFTDDVALSQYKIDIHNNFDCHSHGRLLQDGSEPWFVSRIEKLEGNAQRIVEKLTVPENVTAGNYHLLIYCLDKVGNEAQPLVYSMKIQNLNDTAPPVVSVTSPHISGAAIRRGETLVFEGSVTDNMDLTGGRMEISYYDPSNTLFTASQYFFPAGSGKATTFSIPINVEAYARTGLYMYHVRVYDRYNNSSETIIAVTVE